MNEEVVRQKLIDGINGEATVEVTDLRGSGDHFHIKVVSSVFEGLLTVKRHRLIHKILEEELKGPIHAVSLETLTPSEI